MDYNIMEIQDQVKENMTKKRFFHTLGVQYTSTSLAMKYNYNIEKAELAGLLHDYAKCYDDDTMIAKCQDYNIPITEYESKLPYLLHTKLGAHYAKAKFGINEPDVLDAITYHTTGRPNMSMIEKIVFVADYIEPSRKMIPKLEEIRKVAFENIDLAVYMILNNTLIYLKENSDKLIDPMTENAYLYYKDWYENEMI
jgi:predicted HD superfamily hydrolase involved in NAD metabolism